MTIDLIPVDLLEEMCKLIFHSPHPPESVAAEYDSDDKGEYDGEPKEASKYSSNHLTGIAVPLRVVSDGYSDPLCTHFIIAPYPLTRLHVVRRSDLDVIFQVWLAGTIACHDLVRGVSFWRRVTYLHFHFSVQGEALSQMESGNGL